MKTSFMNPLSIARTLFGFVLLAQLVSFSFTQQALALDTIQLNEVDILTPESVQLNETLGTAQFSVFETTTGISTTYHLDFASGNWASWDTEGNTFSGQLPPDADLEMSIPCFAGPWAFAGCLVGAGLGGWYCDRRDAQAHARAVSDCGERGIQTFTAGICGAGASHTCRPFDAAP